jgi:hypothetical protein
LSRAVLAVLRGREAAAERADRARAVALERFAVPAMIRGTVDAWQRFLR